MSPAKLKRFADAERYFICPLCREELRLSGTSLRCANRHTFDIAKQGYVNLVPAAKQSQYYSKQSFENRRTVLEGGYYQHVLEAVLDAVAKYCASGTILDAGCGEGFYARAVQRANPAATMLAFDIAKDSVQLAARDDASMAVKWFVGNLAELPLRDHILTAFLIFFANTLRRISACGEKQRTNYQSSARGQPRQAAARPRARAAATCRLLERVGGRAVLRTR
ncbi:putative RNA methyltransferase [Bifidobacterium canis]|uniref:putative RNA methyltransferase n=1 Tax=Bifidobacterium canis TaxID=2610880 RepID=UPI001FE88602|nr:methyltransferase domain-containing protein [Bifidobacterium canis]